MKMVYPWLAIALLAVAAPLSSDAQLLKNLMNNMNQNVTNKAAGQPAAAGKPDSTKPNHGYDSAYLTQMMAKANKQKPSISPADSAAAIKNFMTGTGGSGIRYQYHIAYIMTSKKKDSTMLDTMSIAVTDGHNTRTDMGLAGSKIEVLGHAGLPRYSVMVYVDSRTYRFNIIDTAAINSGDGNTYQVTRVGSETIQGYNCIHSKMTMIIAGTKTSTVEDIWTSTDVPGYSMLKKLIAVQNVTPKMMQALEQAGCGGFFVKMTMQTKEMSMNMLLVEAARKSFPDAMFQIPPGYTQAANPNPFAHGMQRH